MRGKQPKERERYVLRMAGGMLVEVSREVYLEWYQSRRREKYQKEQEHKYRVCSLERLEETGDFFVLSTKTGESVEETALQNICREKVGEVLKSLPAEDRRLIKLLYFEERTITDVAGVFGCSRKTIENRRKRVLKELRQKMQEWELHGGISEK